MRAVLWSQSCAISGLAQCLASGAPGGRGGRAAPRAGRAPRRGCGSAPARPRRTAAPPAGAPTRSSSSATAGAAQWMGNGPCGAAGAPAACPAGEAAGRGRATAPTQPRSSGDTSVREVTYKWIFATVILAQFMATGAPGAVGELAVGRAMGARRGGTGAATTHAQPVAAGPVLGLMCRSRGAARTCAQWMETGGSGNHGASALLPVEEESRPGCACAAAQPR